ncbi:MAG: hypothetical protein P1U68_04335 [Verrucomicrobiales bacterium]|nr:hypothetical protein [Verrucomicrobiales bacterium]
MTTPFLPILAEASDPYASPLFALFLAFAIAALSWLILWLLSAGDSDEPSNSDSGAVSKAAPAAKAKSAVAKKKTPAKKAEPVEATPPADLPEGTDPTFETASVEEAAGLYSEELSSGLVKQDPVYGIVYLSAPEEVDDLKKIKGVAKVLEGKLHSIGVYRFKQVAVWTDEACKEFSKLLTFKNRIYTDNWIAQAKGFHEEKYGDKL